jgi:hypothetical protein
MDYQAWADGGWDRTPDLWENQGGGLDVRQLRRALDDAVAYRAEWAELPVVVELFGGAGDRTRLAVAEIGLTGAGDRPDAIVLTVVRG